MKEERKSKHDLLKSIDYNKIETVKYGLQLEIKALSIVIRMLENKLEES